MDDTYSASEYNGKDSKDKESNEAGEQHTRQQSEIDLK